MLIDESFRHEFVTIAAELIAKAGQGVQPQGFGGEHLEFVVDKKVNIFARGHFLFPGLHCLVLIVGIQELSSRDGVPPNAKQYRLICRLSVGAERAGHEQQARY